MATRDKSSFDAAVARALLAIGHTPDDEAQDPLADPSSSSAMLAEAPDRALLRGAPLLGDEAPGYGPEPRDPVWMHLEPRSLEVRTSTLRGAREDRRTLAAVRVERADVDCCDTPSCVNKKTRTTVTLDFEAGDGAEGVRLVVAESLGPEDGRVVAVAKELAAYTGATLSGDSSASSAEAADAGTRRRPKAGALARFSMRREGARIVLRDYDDPGPRGGAGWKLLVAAILAVAAGLLWAQTVQSARAGAGTGQAIGFGALAAFITVAAYAFFGVARFAGQYVATSAPRVVVGRDRLVVAPWVSRAGAIDERPEGRFGVAIPMSEVKGVAVADRGGSFALEIVDVEHGPFDAIVSDREDVAELWCAALERSIAEAAHAAAGATPRRRAGARRKQAAEKKQA